MELDKAIGIVRAGVMTQGLKVNDSDILELAGKIFISSNIPNKSYNPPISTPAKATQKQIDTLYRLNADFNADTITKKEAYEMLSKLLPKKK